MSIKLKATYLPGLLLFLAIIASAQTAANPFASVQDDPKLPRVLIIGDSISIGYTIPVRQLLKGKANVHRIPVNGEYSAYGLAHIKDWLGEGKWDVIFFNWGIWDTHLVDADGKLTLDESDLNKLRIRTPVADYQKNLNLLVDAMEATKARLIWASSTPCSARKGTRFDDIAKYNKAAAEVMNSRHIAITDLYPAMLPYLSTMQAKDGYHYTQEGYEYLGMYVAAAIFGAITVQTSAADQ